MKQRTDKSDINEEYNISIFRNGGLPRLPELVKHDDSDTIQRSYKCVHWDNVLYARYHEFLPLWKHLFYLNVFDFYLLHNCNGISIAIIDL